MCVCVCVCVCLCTVGAEQAFKLSQNSDRVKLLQEVLILQTSVQLQHEATHHC